jgi:hypothetical protein
LILQSRGKTENREKRRIEETATRIKMRRSSSTSRRASEAGSSRRASETGSSRRASETGSSRRTSEIGSPRRASVMDDNSEAAAPIRRKLRDSRIKIATVVHRCEQKDRNGDGIIHLDDLEDILNDIVPPENRITRRELLRFATALMGEKNNGSIKYEKLSDVIEPPRKRDPRENEKWADNDDDEGDTRWATQPGIVPLEIFLVISTIR